MSSTLTTFEQLRATAVRSQRLAAQAAGLAADAIEEIDIIKADKPSAAAITIPVSGWKSDSAEGWPKYYDIPVTGITATDRAEITLAPGSISTAKACGLCPTCETIAGKIRVRASSVPATTIAAEYWIEDGKE